MRAAQRLFFGFTVCDFDAADLGEGQADDRAELCVLLTAFEIACNVGKRIADGLEIDRGR
jgi:hypothetical protein